MDDQNDIKLMESIGLPMAFGSRLNTAKTVPLQKTEEANSVSIKSTQKESNVSEIKSEGLASAQFKQTDINGSLDSALPLKYTIAIPAHNKAVSSISFNLKGSRMITGGMDSLLRIWDFHSMNSPSQWFKNLEPNPGHSIQGLSYSCSGSNFICAAGDTMIRIFDSDGQQLQDTVRGDMYIRDMANTKGHTHMITDCKFHPYLRDLFITSSMDATVRIWDLNSAPYGVDQSLTHTHCLKAVDKRNMNISKCHVSCCSWSPNGRFIVGGCVDGSIQIWNEKRSYGKPDLIVRTGHNDDVIAVEFFNDDQRLLSRSLDDTMKLWDARKFKEPIYSWTSLNTIHSKTGVTLSPDELYIVAPTQGISKKDADGHLKFFDAKTFQLVKDLQIHNSGAIKVMWPKDINQICVGCSDGSIHFYFDDKISNKGALLFAHKEKTKAQTDEDFQFNAPIFTPDNLPDGYKETRTGMIKKVKPYGKDKDRNQIGITKTITPPRPSGNESTGGQTATSRTFSQTIMGNMNITKVRADDSVEILRSYASIANQNPVFTGKAYEKTQPQPVLDYSMDQNDEEELLSSSTKCPRCGLKMCQCGYLGAQKSVFGPNKKFQKTA